MMTMMRTAALAAIAVLSQPALVRADPAGVDRIFSRFDKPDAPGCVVDVVKDGRSVLARGYGAANLETRTPITPDTAFDIGSTAKQFTAASVLLLAQDGKLSLDDDVRKYIPELHDHGTPVRIRQLLNHTSGVRDYVSLLSFADVDPGDLSTQSQALDMLARQRALNNLPGARFLYSNSNFLLAAVIVERISGKSLRDFAHERIFAPLGMTHTEFADDYPRLIVGSAAGYAPGEGGWRRAQTHWNEVGDGGLSTTVRDLERWDANFYAPKVGGPDFAAAMTRTGMLNDGAETHYGLGLMIDSRHGLTRVHHGGASEGFRAELVRYPERRLSVAVLCNASSVDASDLANATADLWLPSDPAAPTAGRPPTGPVAGPATVAGWAGVYRNPDSGAVRMVEVQAGRATITAFGGRRGLKPVGPDTAELVDGPLVASYRFRPDSLTETALDRDALYERLELARPTAETLRAYAGVYACPELDRIWRLEIVDGKLIRRDPRTEPWTFDPLDRDRFSYGNLTISFHRAGDGVDGAVLDIGRVRGIVCPRTGG
jgi:CubicO group peptidase (beta-lactamase class C family)